MRGEEGDKQDGKTRRQGRRKGDKGTRKDIKEMRDIKGVEREREKEKGKEVNEGMIRKGKGEIKEK